MHSRDDQKVLLSSWTSVLEHDILRILQYFFSHLLSMSIR